MPINVTFDLYIFLGNHVNMPLSGYLIHSGLFKMTQKVENVLNL